MCYSWQIHANQSCFLNNKPNSTAYRTLTIPTEAAASHVGEEPDSSDVRQFQGLEGEKGEASLHLTMCKPSELTLPSLQLKEKKDKLDVSATKKKEAFVAGRTHGV